MNNQKQNNPDSDKEPVGKSTPENKESRKTVLKKIRNGEVKMRPKAYFILKILSLIIIVLATLIISSLVISFIIFSIKVSGRMVLLGFGARGVFAFFTLFPWKMLIVAAILLLILEWLVKKFKFGYRNPFIYLLSGILIISIIAGYIINGIGFHQLIFRNNRQHPLPFLGGFYEHLRRPSDQKNIFIGTIKNINGNIFTVEDQNNPTELQKVIVMPDLASSNFFKAGDKVFIAGDTDHNETHAFGIRKLGPEFEREID